MKKLLILLLPLGLMACDGTVDSKTYPLVKPDHVYEFDGWGSNPDIYEFTPKANPDYTCIYAISGSDKYIQMQCIPKKIGE